MVHIVASTFHIEVDDRISNRQNATHQVGNTTPFRIIADVGEMVILPPEFADAIRNDTDLDFMTFVNGQFHSEIPGFEVFREGTKTTLVTDVVRVKITQSLGKVTEPLADECDQASRQVFGDSKEWKEFVLKPTLLDLVARISARVFLGEEGCRNPAWLKITKEYTVDAFIAGVELRKYPPGIRHVIHWFLPQCKAVRAHQQTARNIINEVLHARKVEDQQRLAQGLKPKARNDAVEWFEQMAKGRNYDAATVQIALAMAAVHTTTDLLSQTLYDIMQHPEIVPALREEIATVISQDGWEKTALYKMKLMDSVIKESQRIKPPNVVSMNRVAMKDVKLPDGSIIPAGSKIGVSAHAMWDPSVHSDPGSWDGYRWLKMRQQEGQENLHQLATTTPQHIAFGHGKHSCPGRFFAANEIKIALCFLLMNYDFKLTLGVKPKPVAAGIQLDSDPTAKVQVRRSEPHLDLVARMFDIYDRASQCMCYVGEHSDETDTALNFVKPMDQLKIEMNEKAWSRQHGSLNIIAASEPWHNVDNYSLVPSWCPDRTFSAATSCLVRRESIPVRPMMRMDDLDGELYSADGGIGQLRDFEKLFSFNKSILNYPGIILDEIDEIIEDPGRIPSGHIFQPPDPDAFYKFQE
ncbi:Cytochrome P450 monooygenase 1 [Colletotrichum sp. SAR 10_96]|nr:Cytochrome P450 monooygenase 1 [Colletotrichum sp. SAR 10_96]